MCEWRNPDPDTHHPFCAFYRYGRRCSCFEGQFPSGPEADALLQRVNDGTLTGLEALRLAKELRDVQ